MLPNMTHWNPHSGSFQFTSEGLPCTTQSLRNRQILSGSSLSPDSFLSSLKCECFCGLGRCTQVHHPLTTATLWSLALSTVADATSDVLFLHFSQSPSQYWRPWHGNFWPEDSTHQDLLSTFATSFWGTWHSVNAILYDTYVLDTLISCMTMYTSFFFTSVCFFMTHSPQAKFLNFSWDLQPYTKLYFVNTPLACFSLHSCSYGPCSHTSIFIEVYLTSLQRGK